MADLSTTLPDISSMEASQLEQLRRNIIAKYSGQTQLDDMTIDDLHHLAAITSALRRKTVTAPKPKRKAEAKPKAKPAKLSADDIFNLA